MCRTMAATVMLASRRVLEATSSPRRGPDRSRDRPRVRRRIRGRTAAWVALGILGAHLVAAPQLLGGVFDWAVAITGVTAVIALGAATFATRRSETPWP